MIEKKILAIASGGGHWVQLLRMRSAWDGCNLTYVTTKAGYAPELLEDAKERKQKEPHFFLIVDANRWQKLKLLKQLMQVVMIILRVRPNVIISTGASPGFFALKIGKMLGAKTIWVDSIANAQELSLSGCKVSSSADLWLTQWSELANEDGFQSKSKPGYAGSVI